MPHTVLVVLAVVAIVGYVIGRQLLGEPIRGRRLVVLPLVITVLGAVDLTKQHARPVDVAFIAVGAMIAAGVGLGQGAMMRLENRNGGLWGQMPVKGLWLWAALVASRGLVELGAHAGGAQVAASAAPLLLLLGVNRIAQAGTITVRAVRAGIPFAAEPDGTTFLSGGTSPGLAMAARRTQLRDRRAR